MRIFPLNEKEPNGALRSQYGYLSDVKNSLNIGTIHGVKESLIGKLKYYEPLLNIYIAFNTPWIN